MSDKKTIEDKIIDDAVESYSPKKEEGIIRRLPRKLERLQNSSAFKSLRFLLQTVQTLFEMLKTREFNVSFSTKAMIVAALTYFILPTDLTPDFIPFIGYIDDTAVIVALLRRIGNEVQRFEEWKLSKSSTL